MDQTSASNTGASKSVTDLQHRVPNATAEECQRFHESFSNKSTERLTAYLEWRKEHQLNSPLWDETTADTETTTTNDDARNWQKATELAIAHARKNSNDFDEKEMDVTSTTEIKQHCNKESGTVFHARDNDLTRPIYSHAIAGNPLCDTKGHRVLQILSARVDLQAACANTYATAFSLFLDSHLRRDNLDRLTLLIDVRPGSGWPNVPALKMVGFIRCVAQVLQECYPCRLHQCILFPIPRPALFIWNIVQHFLDPLVRRLIVLIPGPAGLTSPVPRDRLKDYVDLAGLDLLEQTRLEAFCKKE